MIATEETIAKEETLTRCHKGHTVRQQFDQTSAIQEAPSQKMRRVPSLIYTFFCIQSIRKSLWTVEETLRYQVDTKIDTVVPEAQSN
jgi:hypothetical protein